MRQRLREWYQEAQAKRGEHRTELDVRHSFAPLLAWVLSGWQGTQLALALDATTLGQRFVVLAVSVVYRGCAIPVAWKILPATEKHAWRAAGLRLLKHLRPAIPAHLFVIVLADRGLYARWLFRRIVRLGWHPFLRVNLGGQFCPEGENRFRPLKSFVPTIGTQWAGQGTAFKTKAARLKSTLLARWEAGYTDPWLILTDLSPDCADAARVRAAGLDRAGIQDHQACRLAMAADAHDRSATGGTPVVGRGRGHALALERGRRSRGRDSREYLSRSALRRAAKPQTAALRHPLALGQCLSPRLAADSGGDHQSGAAPVWHLYARSLAHVRSQPAWTRFQHAGCRGWRTCVLNVSSFGGGAWGDPIKTYP
jgi:hypothetical protein